MQNGVVGTQLSDDNLSSKYYRLFWNDFAGWRRCRVVTSRVYQDVVENGLGIVSCIIQLPVFADMNCPGSGFGPFGVVYIVPVSTYHIASPYYDLGAFCVSEIMESTGPKGKPFSCCPRNILKKCSDQLVQETGCWLEAGFEHEFILLNEKDEQPIDKTVYASAIAFNNASQVLYSMVDTLESCGSLVHQFHPEAAQGQFEITTVHFTVLEACDRVLLSKDIIGSVAKKFGMRPTFVPKFGEMIPGNGMHCNFSLNNTEGNITGNSEQKYGLSESARQFIAGVLHFLPALCVFLLPSYNSYERKKVGFQSGAFQIWGHENKEAPIRVVQPPKNNKQVHVEIKAFDSATNPYIGLATITVAGLIGIKRSMELSEPFYADPANISQEERDKLRIKLLPETLQEAINTFEKDEFKSILTEATSAEFVQCFLAVRKFEAEFFKGKTLEEQVEILKWSYS